MRPLPAKPVVVSDRYARALSTRLLPLTLLLAASSLVAASLVCFPPDQYSFYPQCPIESLLHIQCPGCGGTRALAALLHGHLQQALRLNPLTVCALPATLIYLLWQSLRSLLGLPVQALPVSPATLGAGFAAVTLYTLLRNL